MKPEPAANPDRLKPPIGKTKGGAPCQILSQRAFLHTHFRQWTDPMVESDRGVPGQPLRQEPQVLANIPPSTDQRLAILAATWPFATVKLPEIDAFVPSLAAALLSATS
jgi:hypothetical protein